MLARKTRRRSGVTLIEVLVAIFVMAIGLLCVLTLFVLGAQRMATAFKDSNAAQAAINAGALANIKNVRNDAAVIAKFQGADDGPGTAVFVDPAGMIAGANLTSKIPRVSPSFAPDNSPTSLQYFSLLDDITFQRGSGVPKLYGPNIEREILYTWAYLVQRQRQGDPSSTNAYACVFQRRPKAGQLETVYPASLDPASNTITISASAGTANILPGMWLLDATGQAGGKNVFSNFYRITGTRDGATAGSLVIDLQGSLQGYASATSGEIVILDGLVEVFDLGTGR